MGIEHVSRRAKYRTIFVIPLALRPHGAVRHSDQRDMVMNFFHFDIPGTAPPVGINKEIVLDTNRRDMTTAATTTSTPTRTKTFKLVPWKPTAEDWKKAESNPIFRHFCMFNQYQGNPQMYELLGIIMDVYEEDQMSLNDLNEVLDSVEFGYKRFHGLTPSPVDWSKVESSRLLWGDVKIDGAYQKRAEGYIRATVQSPREYGMKLARQAKKRG
jgi:hypothetical protein